MRVGRGLHDTEDLLSHMTLALESLRVEDRRVLRSYYAGDQNCRATAQECGIAPSLVKVRLFRARRRLTRALRRRIAADRGLYEEPERPSESMELENRILRSHVRMIRMYVEDGKEIPEEYLRDEYEPPPWEHEMEGMDRAQRIRHHQMRSGIRGKPEDVWGYKPEETTP